MDVETFIDPYFEFWEPQDPWIIDEPKSNTERIQDNASLLGNHPSTVSDNTSQSESLTSYNPETSNTVPVPSLSNQLFKTEDNMNFYYPQQFVYQPLATPTVRTVTLNPNNFEVAPVTNIRYVKDSSSSSRKRTLEPSNDGETLMIKRLKKRDAARRWRQEKKEQFTVLQDEVYTLKHKIQGMQIEMDALRSENFYLKKELEHVRNNSIDPSIFSELTNKVTNYTTNISQPYTNMTTINMGRSTDSLQFNSTPSLVLLCIFLFYFAFFSPSLHNGGAYYKETHPLLASPVDTPKLPRVFTSYSKFQTPPLRKSDELVPPKPTDIFPSTWQLFFGVPVSSGVNVENMNKRLHSSSGLRLDRTFL